VNGDFTHLHSHRPDLVLLDLDLPEDILALATQIRRQSHRIRIAVTGMKWSDVQLNKALSIGIEGILHKNESTDALFEHLRHIAAGERRISTALVHRLNYDAQQKQYVLASGNPLTTLTALQLEILRLLAYGDSLKMVASKLHLSRKSIDGHKYRLMRKLGVKDRVLLSRLAIREGLIQP
jgi:DNA-binding NarL/FixJ family response regulator